MEILFQHMNGKMPPMEEPAEVPSGCGQLTTRGKTKALLKKNFLRMWRNVGYVSLLSYLTVYVEMVLIRNI